MSVFLPVCTCPPMAMEEPQVLILDLQINFLNKSTKSIDLGFTNKFYWIDEFANTESVSNEEQWTFNKKGGWFLLKMADYIWVYHCLWWYTGNIQ